MSETNNNTLPHFHSYESNPRQFGINYASLRLEFKIPKTETLKNSCRFIYGLFTLILTTYRVAMLNHLSI